MSNPVLQRLVTEREQTNGTIDQILDGANEDERDLSDSERELVTRQKARLQSWNLRSMSYLTLRKRESGPRMHGPT